MPLALIRRLVKMEEIFEVSVVDEEGNFYTPEPQSTHNSELLALQLDEGGKRASDGSKAELVVNASDEPSYPEISPPEPSQASSCSSGDLEEDSMHLTDLQKAILSKVSLVQRSKAQSNSEPVNDAQASCSSTTTSTPSKSKSVLLSFDERIASSDQSDEEIDDPEPLQGAWLHPKQRALFEATQSDSSPAFVDINNDVNSIEVPSFNEIEILEATQRSPIIHNDPEEDVYDSPCNEDGSGQSDSNPSSETTKRISTLSGVKSLPVKPVSSATEAMNEVTSTKNFQGFPKWQILEEGSTAKLPRKRFFEPPPNEEPQKPIGGTLDPRCKRQRRATLLTEDGPIDVSIVPSKAVRCPGKTDKYRCPVTDCRLKGRQGSRVFISRHFCEEHKDFRSWRDVFIKKDAPPFILKDIDPPKFDSPSKSLESPTASVQRRTPSPKTSHMSTSSTGRQEEEEPLHALEKHVKFSIRSQEEEIPPSIMTARSSSITSGTETSWAQTAPICASSEVQSAQICASSETQDMVYQTNPQVIPQVLPQVSQAPQNSVPIRSEPMVTVQVPASSFFSPQNLAQPMIPQSFPLVNPYQQVSQVPQAQNVPMALVPLSMLSGLQTQTQQCVPQIIYPQQGEPGQGMQFLSPPGPVNMAPIPNNSSAKTENSEIMVQGQKYKIIQVAVPSKITPPSAVKGGPINESHKPVHLLPISQASPLWHQVVSSLNTPTSTPVIGHSQASNTKVVSSGTDSCQPVKPISNNTTSQNSNPSLGISPGSQAFGFSTQYHPQLQQFLQQSQQHQHQPMTFQYVQPTQQVQQVQSGLPHQIPMSLVSMSQMMPQHQQQTQTQQQTHLQAYSNNQPQPAFMIPMYAQPQQQPQQ